VNAVLVGKTIEGLGISRGMIVTRCYKIVVLRRWTLNRDVCNVRLYMLQA